MVGPQNIDTIDKVVAEAYIEIRWDLLMLSSAQFCLQLNVLLYFGAVFVRTKEVML